jgi:hypothetical protein
LIRAIQANASAKRIPLIPSTGDMVIYYTDGNAAAIQDIEDRELPHMAIHQPLINEAHIGKEHYCRIVSMKYFSGGPIHSPSKCYPYVNMDLDIFPVASFALPSENVRPLMSSSTDEHEQVSEVLARKILKDKLRKTIQIILTAPDSSPFVLPVSVKDFPDYFQVVAKGMDLTKVQQNVSKNRYSNFHEFLNDVCLIKDNCVSYCTSRFPTIVPMAHNLYNLTLQVCNRLFPSSSNSANGTRDMDVELGNTL